jgi:hypothetical protein
MGPYFLPPIQPWKPKQATRLVKERSCVPLYEQMQHKAMLYEMQPGLGSAYPPDWKTPDRYRVMVQQPVKFIR